MEAVEDSWSRNHSRAGGTEFAVGTKAEAEEESLPRGRDGGKYEINGQVQIGITPARAGRSPRRWC